MPIYEYRCGGCDARFEKIRPMSEKDAPLECPLCGESRARRQLSVFAASVASDSSCGWSESAGACLRPGCMTSKR